MPIRPENRDRYPSDWPAISLAVRAAADQRCECTGECGSDRHERWRLVSLWDPTVPDARCPAVNGEPSPLTGSLVVLTVAHLDHTPENCSVENLRAMCQSCHLNYDRDHHAETRAATRTAARAGATL